MLNFPLFVYLFAATTITLLFIRNPLVWPVSMVLTLVVAYFEHRINANGIAFVVVMLALCIAVRLDRYGNTTKNILKCLIGLFGLMLALHLVFGFNNLVLLKNQQISANGSLFTQYINLDKGIAGLLMVASFCQPMSMPNTVVLKDKKTWLIALFTISITLILAIITGVTRFQPQWTNYTVTFLVVNLFFTCIAEEAFFRGGIQQGISKLLPKYPIAAVAVSAITFGLSHIGGGVKIVFLATVAGLGYSLIYQHTKRINASIATHFAFNAVHFLLFVYPSIA